MIVTLLCILGAAVGWLVADRAFTRWWRYR